jgi:hypothetical protein
MTKPVPVKPPGGLYPAIASSFELESLAAEIEGMMI